MEKLILVMPVYNEAQCIEGVIRKWHGVLSSLNVYFRILAINDGSKDDSLPKLNSLKNEFSELIVVDKRNSGHGPTLVQGYKSLDRNVWCFQIDSDDEIGTDKFLELWNARINHEFVIGRRLQRGGALARRLITFVLRLLVHCLFGRKVYDINCPFRLFKVSAFAEFIHKLDDDCLVPNVLMSAFANDPQIRVAEYPVTFAFRTTGEVSIKRWRLVKFSIRSFGQLISYRLRK